MRDFARLTKITSASALILLAWSARAQDPVDAAAIEARGARISAINVHVDNVFDLSNPDEDKKLYAFANRVHILSRESTIRNILLIEPGDPVSLRLFEESARALRSRGFVADARVEISSYDESTNAAVVDVYVRDSWSLTPELDFGRSGGKNEYSIGASEENLIGLGKDLTVAYESNIDRDEAILGYSDANVRGTRTRFDMLLSNASDGERQIFSILRPFYALDSRWSVGADLRNDERVESMYGLGEIIDKFNQDTHLFSLHGGWSHGLKGDRALRWLVGVTREENSFGVTPDFPEPLLTPQDRELVYPWFGFQIVEDDFREMSELNDMGRTEDISLGLNLTVQLGHASESYGSDRNAEIISAAASKGWEPGGPGRLLLFKLSASARNEESGIANSLISTDFSYFRRNLGKHLFSAHFSAVLGQALDAENQVLLGGDNGLRGYPLRYQSGESSASITLEQRFFTDWYPFRLLRVGYAVFFDAGRVWGDDARGTPNLGTLYDVGVGLRVTSPRSTGSSVVHIDLAFPINAQSDIDSVQLTIEKKASF